MDALVDAADRSDAHISIDMWNAIAVSDICLANGCMMNGADGWGHGNIARYDLRGF